MAKAKKEVGQPGREHVSSATAAQMLGFTNKRSGQLRVSQWVKTGKLEGFLENARHLRIYADSLAKLKEERHRLKKAGVLNVSPAVREIILSGTSQRAARRAARRG